MARLYQQRFKLAHSLQRGVALALDSRSQLTLRSERLLVIGAHRTAASARQNVRRAAEAHQERLPLGAGAHDRAHHLAACV